MANQFQWSSGHTNFIKILAGGVFVLLAASVLFPVFPHVSERARTRFCASNLKQIGLALEQYELDYDRKLPNVAQSVSATQTWRTALYPYIKSHSIFQCPSRTYFDALDGFPVSYAANDTGIYGLPAGAQGLGAFAPSGAKPLTTADYTDPAGLISICEITGTAGYDFDIDDSARFVAGHGRLWAKHKDGKFNALLADGHILMCVPGDTASYRDTINGFPKNLWYRDNTRQESRVESTVIERAEQ